MSINVGSVSVRVVPDARDFDNRLRADLGNLPDQRVRVTPDTTGFRERVRQTVQPSGQESGGLLAQGMRQGFMRQSPLITAAIAGALTAGAPAIIGAGTILFGALGALAVKSNAQVKAAWTALGADIKTQAAADAASLVPIYSRMAGQIDTEFQKLSPEIAQAFQAVGPLMESFSGAILKAADTAVPGLVNAVKGAGPVITGLDVLVVDIGKGVAGLFDAVTQHAGAAGTVFSSLGGALQTLLPTLGTLIGEGAELGASVLPPLVGVLRGLGAAIGAIAPVLPTVVLGFAGFKVAQLAAGYLGTFAQRLAMASYSSSSFAGIAGRASTAVSGIAKALPVVGVGVALLGAAFSAGSQDIDDWAHALLDGGNAAEQAAAQMQHIHDVTQAGLGGLHSWGDVWDRIKALTLGTSNAQADAAQKAKELTAAMSPLERAQQNVTKTQNDYLLAVQKWGSGSGQAVAASQLYRDAQDKLKGMQGLLATATDGATTAAQQNATRLQGIATASSNASGQINLLAGALNALTGKQVSETQAQIAVTQAVNNAITSVKGLHGGLVDANGALTVQTEKGAAAQQALIQLAGSDNTLIATMIQHGATSDQVSAKDAALRDQFIKTAEQMGYTKTQAKQLADQIYGIPTKRNTEFTADTLKATFAVDALIKKYNGKTISMNVAYSNFGANYGHNWNAGGGKASGGLIRGPGGPTDDKAGLYHLSDKEYVVRASSVSKYGVPFMDALNAGHLATGGLVLPSTVKLPVNLSTSGIAAALQKAIGSITSALGGAGAGAGGASRWSGVVEQVMGMLGLPQAALAGILHIIQAESGGNPNAINLTDSNARAGHPSQGLMQTIPSTFYRWAGALAGRGITDPLANVYAGTNYALHTYGLGMLEGGGRSSGGRYIGYDQGGTLDPGYHLTYNGTGAPELIAPKQTFMQAMSGASGGSGPASFVGNLYLDSGEFLGKVRGVAEQTINDRNAATARNIRSAR